ncbi:TIGR02281 family clan AA aspartic protease [Pelomonas sp. HMWF004]|nr:TIGR02281 family clan AA aspartic protease [Pelomonas sp. HMWF004]
MLRRLCLTTALLGLHWAVNAQPPAPTQVQLNGTMGSRAALLLIDGTPRTVEVGATVMGVKLVSMEDGRVVVDIGGARQTLSMGAAPGRVLAQNRGKPGYITMPAGAGGHFTTAGMINGRLTTFLVDTGATNVAISQVEADRLGLRYQAGRRTVTQTANGAVPAFTMQLASVRIGEVEVLDVEAIVIPGQLSHVLLGNSFLNRFQMRRENDVMTLESRP